MQFPNLSDVKRMQINGVKWFISAVVLHGVNFHPDTEFYDYLAIPSGKQTFKRNRAIELNAINGECFAICSANNIDYYELAHAVTKQLNTIYTVNGDSDQYQYRIIDNTNESNIVIRCINSVLGLLTPVQSGYKMEDLKPISKYAYVHKWEWETALSEELALLIECDYSDAQGILGANESTVFNQWMKAATPEETAQLINQLSIAK